MTHDPIDQIIRLLPVLSSWLIARVLTNDLILLVLITAVLAIAGFICGHLLMLRLEGKKQYVKIVAAIALFILVLLLPVLVDTALDLSRI
jgi:phage-related holin